MYDVHTGKFKKRLTLGDDEHSVMAAEPVTLHLSSTYVLIGDLR